jgi:hypothetical protein
MTGIIIVDKTATLKILNVKELKEEELYKKCGFKKSDGFIKQTEWMRKIDGEKYFVSLYAKTDGKANSENKYDFPPPIDNKLFFGSCALVAYIKNKDEILTLHSLTLPLWNKIYEKLFGGFEDLAITSLEDEEEEDELANIPAKKKTKEGYLKDGFVVDSNGESDDYETEDDEDEDDEDAESTNSVKNDKNDENDELLIEDIGSELSEEEYESE